MSDDDNRRGPRGPRKPGGPGRGSFGGARDGGFKGGKGRGTGGGFKARGPKPEGGGFGGRDERPPRSDGERPARSGGFKTTGFQPSGRSGGFRDAPERPERPDRPNRFDRPRQDRGERGGERSFDKPRFDRGAGPREEGFRPRSPRREGEDRPPRRFDGDRPQRDDRPRRFDGERPQREDRGGYRGQDRGPGRGEDRPRSASRPERRPFLPREGRPERLANPEKEGGVERIAKVIARAGAASRRDAEEMILQGRVTVDGERIASPALDVPPTARIAIDGESLPARERTRLWLYHKPSGLVTTNHDPEGRQTVFETLPEDLPRVITIGRLDINTEGLLLLTNDGGLARVLGHPETAWLRRYRVRAFGHITQDKLDAVREGLTIDGESFGPVVATRDREVGDNTWLTVDLREGKNREVKRVLEHLGLVVNRLIRVSFGPFQLGDLAEGEVEEVRTKVLRDQLGDQLASIAGVDFEAPVRSENRLDRPHPHEEQRPRGDSRGPTRGREDRGDSRGARPRFDDRPPRRDAEDKPERPRREGAYHRAREESGDAPRDILLRAEEGRGAIWRDEETTGMKPKRTGPRRGADPREERASRATRDAEGGRERVRATPISDPSGRRVQVERVTGPSPDLPRKPRYTRADFAAPSGEERPFRRPRPDDGERGPRRDAGDRAPRRDFSDRPPRAEGDRPFRKPRADGGEGFKPRGPRQDFGDRPPRRDGERSFKPRAEGDRGFKARGDDRGGFKPRADDRGFKPRGDAPRPERSFRDRDEGGGRGGFGGKPPGKGGPRSGPSGGARKPGGRGAPDRGGGAGPRGPRKPKF